ncbi:MAG: urease accessory protein, partial [Steroidobacteraceae bacterium]
TLGQAVRHGVAWGIGHTIVLSAFAGAVLALGTQVPDYVAGWLEFVVGLMLIALGVDVIVRLVRRRIHFHIHEHEGGVRHVHAHSHAGEGAHSLSAHQHGHGPALPMRSLAVGMVHGLAGSAAMVLLSLDAVETPLSAVMYIALFGAGSILGMAILSAAIALPLRLSATRIAGLHNGLTAAVGVMSCLMGLLVVYRQLAL